MNLLFLLLLLLLLLILGKWLLFELITHAPNSRIFGALNKMRNVNSMIGIADLLIIATEKLRIPNKRVWMLKEKSINSFLGKLFDASFWESFAHEGPEMINNSDVRKNVPKNCIWIYWSNLEEIPPLVYKCVKQLRKYASTASVYVVGPSNIFEYIDLPDYIIQKYKAGIISQTHFGDIVRMALLLKYGGIYMDATVFLTSPIPSEVERMDFYSIKIKLPKPYLTVSRGRWCVFYIKCRPGNLLIKYTLAMMFYFYRSYNVIFDYLWIDYFWDYCVRLFPDIKKMVDDVPYNNPDVFAINDLGEVITYDRFQEIISDKSTWAYKISYKQSELSKSFDDEGNMTLKGIVENCDF